ncbi:DUF4235 domain-containing protein [Paeniglutamicibacter cryotolerans]|uniref:DUF4235 domain-containing protein n=1 Tax=Paeniglutamicibacter cryotolerans TaxID=670079 RepID=A0A839QM59_9MICC|nr:DUF4235 domain-containing protein [Paeniglutamicibacter cryotolerans]MBB2994292.1 hypothetical protein [Paeniglutamicibacter cryotolerans]
MQAIMKIAGPLISIAAGFVGGKIVDKLWLGFTGQEPPKHGNKEALAEASLRQALSFALLSAITAAVIQVLTDRGTQKALARFAKD